MHSSHRTLHMSHWHSAFCLHGRGWGDLSPCKAGGLIPCESRVSCKTGNSLQYWMTARLFYSAHYYKKNHPEHVNIPWRIIWLGWTPSNVKIIKPFVTKSVTLVLSFRGGNRESWCCPNGLNWKKKNPQAVASCMENLVWVTACTTLTSAFFS